MPNVTKVLKGAMTAMITPFSNGKLDEQRLAEQVERQLNSGIDGLVPVGTTGESPTLNVAEHHRVIELTVQAANGRVPVIAGVGANATSEALVLHRFAREVGATAGLSVNPYYNKPTQEGLYRHFMTLADAVDLPIVLYNIPSRTGITMAPATVARLAKHPNIAAIKEATGSLDIASEIRSLCDLPILSGDDSLTLPLISIGAVGVVSVISNLIPRQIHKLVHTALDSQFTQAAELHRRLYPLMRAMFLDGNPVGIKFAMSAAGHDTGELRLPLWHASDQTRATIIEHMKSLGITIH